MCGIGVLVGSDSAEGAERLEGPSLFDLVASDLTNRLANRGPTASNNVDVLHGSSRITFIASVLHIQGDEPTQQPATDRDGRLLLWNGEVFGGYQWSPDESDTSMLMSLLSSRLRQLDSPIEAMEAIMEVLCHVQGPYAFLLYASHQIFYGRDPFGRRSLLTCSCNDTFAISSVSSQYIQPWAEVPIGGLYCMSLEDFSVSYKPWPATQLRLQRYLNPPLYEDGSSSSPPSLPLSTMSSSEKFLELLKQSVKRRLFRCHSADAAATISIPAADEAASNFSPACRVGILFSGGIDSLLLAAVLHLCNENLSEPIELVNIVFCDPSLPTEAPDRLAALAGVRELQALFPQRSWRLVLVNVSSNERQQYQTHILSLLQPSDTHMDLNIGSAFWFAARGQGALATPEMFSDLDTPATYASSAQHSLLRRGHAQALQSVGLDDSKLLLRQQRAEWKAKRASLLSHRKKGEGGEVLVLPEERCQTTSCLRTRKVGCVYHACKRCCDHQQSSCLVERWADSYLALGRPRDWTFPWQELCSMHAGKAKHRTKAQGHLQHLFWQAVGEPQRCSDVPECNGEDEPVDTQEVEDVLVKETDLLPPSTPPSPSSSPVYHSTCKALLVGIGADEQLAGYARHRTVYNQRGEEALVQEMCMDLERLWTRNLGRDDRCISDHGREAWFPYLDEDVVAFLQSLPLSQIADLKQGQGIGDKKILREAARSLGLVAGSELVKRAIQFGSLAAKQTSQNIWGSRRKGKGHTKIGEDEG